MRLPNLAQFRLRILFRGAFLLLAAATVGLALYVLQQEKQLSYNNYRYGLKKTGEQIAATLRHPTGQLALLNLKNETEDGAPLHPVLLPYSSLDFDDQSKVQQAITMSGCLAQYGEAGSLCVAVGNSPWAGGFIYTAGNFYSGELHPHAHGDHELSRAHRVRVTVALRGETYRWIAPFEQIGDAAHQGRGMHGRLTGFDLDADGDFDPRPDKEFRGWIWQSPHCVKSDLDNADCLRSAFYSMRLPIPAFQKELMGLRKPVWPPADLDKIRVRIEVLAPGDGSGGVLFDSDNGGALRPFAVRDLAAQLLPGETLSIRKQGENADLLRLSGVEGTPDTSSRILARLIRKLPLDQDGGLNQSSQTIVTSSCIYELILSGDVRSVDRSLGVVAARMSWFVGAMLLALFVAWFIIEIGIIRRIAVLTKRASNLSQVVRGSGGLDRFELSDLRGGDELGILAACLHDLLRRVKEDVEREEIRAEQEKEMWHAVGHEIMSPLQSLMALHGQAEGPSSRYINRMQQAIRVLYGSASPSEAFQSTVLQVTSVELDAFLKNVADNAPLVGIADVRFTSECGPVTVRADDYSLEDVVTHVLRNAERYRIDGTPIEIVLRAGETGATITIANRGPNIADDMLGKIFEYGVSDQQDSGAEGNRGQGLFVAKTYMAKMGGTIAVQNLPDGVMFTLGLQRINA